MAACPRTRGKREHRPVVGKPKRLTAVVFLRDSYTLILPCTCKCVHKGVITHSCYQFGGPALSFLSIQSPPPPSLTSQYMYRSSYTCSACQRIHLSHSYLILATKTSCSAQSCVGGRPEHLPVNQLLEMSSSLWYKTHTVFHVQMSGFFFFFGGGGVPLFSFFFCFFCLVKRQQSFSHDSETCISETFGPADIVLMSTCVTQRPSVCMHYWLVLYWLLMPQPCSIDRRLWPVNRAGNTSCVFSLYFLFFFFFQWQWLMSKVVSLIFVSLAARQVHRQRLIVLGVTAERQRWRGWGKVEGRLSEHCGPALMQLITATDAGAV